MSRNRLLPPLRGVTDQMANVDTPAQFTAPGGMLNVVPNSGKDGRDNLGTRPPLKKTFVTQLGVKPVNLLAVVGRSVKFNEQWRRGTPLSMTTRALAPVTSGFCCSVLSADGSRLYEFDDPDAAYATANCEGVFADKMPELQTWRTPVLARFCFVTVVDKTYGFGTRKVTRVHLVENQVIVATFECEDKDVGGTVDASAENVIFAAGEIIGDHVVVAAGKYVYVFNGRAPFVSATDYVQRVRFANWPWQMVNLRAGYIRTWRAVSGAPSQAEWRTDDLLPFAFALYRGSPLITGPVTSDTYKQGSYSRAAMGFMFRRESTNGTVYGSVAGVYAVGGTGGLVEGDAKVDDHDEGQPDFRPAEWLAGGKGRIPMDVALHLGYSKVEPQHTFDGKLEFRACLVTSNDGFAMDNTPPDGGAGYINVTDIASDVFYANAATAEFDSRDIQSRKADWLATGWQNDLAFLANGDVSPDNGVGPEVSTTCVAYPRRGLNDIFPFNGTKFIAGSFADGTHVRSVGNVYAADWARDMGTHIGVRGMDFGYIARARPGVPATNSTTVVVVGKRNNTWTDSGGNQACVWFLDAFTGELVESVDFGAGVDARQVSVTNDGLVVVGHEYKP